MELYSTYKRNDTKIIFSEEVYKKLQIAINSTGYDLYTLDRSNMIAGNEYLVFLYGRWTPDGNIFFTDTNDVEYQPMDGKSKPNDGMQLEMENKIINEKFDCFAYVHTHPYAKTESSRFFSDADIQEFKTTYNFANIAKITKRNIIALGGVMTVSGNNIPSEDDIALVHYNDETGEMEYLPNMYVMFDNELVPMKQSTEEVLINDTGHLFNPKDVEDRSLYTSAPIERTYFEVEKKGRAR